MSTQRLYAHAALSAPLPVPLPVEGTLPGSLVRQIQLPYAPCSHTNFPHHQLPQVSSLYRKEYRKDASETYCAAEALPLPMPQRHPQPHHNLPDPLRSDQTNPCGYTALLRNDSLLLQWQSHPALFQQLLSQPISLLFHLHKQLQFSCLIPPFFVVIFVLTTAL